MSAEKELGKDLNFRQKVFRRAARTALERFVFPSEEVHVSDGLKKAEELHQEGYGILALITHFSRRDPIQAMDSFLRSQEFRNTPITGPIALHQTLKGLAPQVAKRAGIELHPIVTQQTLERELAKGKPRHLTRGHGLREYIEAATQTLQDGGIVVMAPQATRRSTLEYDGGRSVEGLLRSAGRKNRNIGIHFMAFGIAGTSDYGQRSGFNLFENYDVYHGATYTLDEAIDLSAEHAVTHNLEANGIKNLDRFVFDEFAKISPQAYLPPSAS